MSEFIPQDFHPPQEAAFEHYVLRPLLAADAEIDCAAVNASIDLIHRTRGGAWPRAMVTVEENIQDLQEHERQFTEREAFAYIILDQGTRAYAGCLYIYPPHHPFDDTDQSGLPGDADAAVSFWVTPSMYESGDYPKLYTFIEGWLTENWPFMHPHIINAEKPIGS